MRYFRIAPRSSVCASRSHRTLPLRPLFECLEDRTLLSGLGYFQPDHLFLRQPGPITPFGTSGPTGYTPSQVRHAYGLDQVQLPGGVVGDGSGTTIAIVDAFDDPNLVSDVHQFDLQFGLPDPVLTRLNQMGGATLPSADSGWASEIALDVEWSHAIAPKAKILLVEANDNYFNSMLTAVTFAAHQPGVVAVSMSWGGLEDSTETSYDNIFVTPIGHTGVTFVASSGDRGAPPEYPAISPNVLSVGGTSLMVDSQGNMVSENAWTGSGGGISGYEAQPSYQAGVVTQSTSFRTNPDVAYDSDPFTGFPVYDSLNNGTVTPWSQFGGTSDAAPQWAALVAIADQGRALTKQGALDGTKQTLPMIYQLSASDFHDVLNGGSLGSPPYPAGKGYDLATGRGTPIASRLVSDLVGSAVPTGPVFSLSAPVNSAAGGLFSITVTAQDKSGSTLTGYTGTVHFTSNDATSFLPQNYTFTASDNGIHTFTKSFAATKTGSDTITATDTSSSSMIGSATVIILAANPDHVGFAQQPTSASVASFISPAVTIQVFDSFNNVVSWDKTDIVTMSLGNNAGGGTLNGTTSVLVNNGIATFSDLSINKAGNGYTLVASSGSLASITSAAFNINGGKANQLAFGQKPTNAPTGTYITPAVTVQVLDAQGNLVTGDNTDSITLALGANAGNASLTGTLTVTVQNGVATFSKLAISKAGTGYTLVASSSGLNAVTSTAFNITPATTSTALVSSANPAPLKQSVTFTATVSGPGTPTGVVTFSDGSTSIGQGTLATSGGTTTASFTTSSLAIGNHTITASYGGDSNFLASTGAMTETVGKTSTTTVVVSSTNPSGLGQSTTFTATISSSGNPTGVVTFSDGGTSIGQGTLSTSGGTTSASFTTSTLTMGNHPITATYAGDVNFAASTSSTITQTVGKSATTTALVSTASATVWGQSVTFTATVSGSGSPTGLVAFFDGTALFAQVGLMTAGGKTTASITVSGLTVGTHTINAAYAGDSNFQTSTATVMQTVSKATSTTLVTSSASPSVLGQSVSFKTTIGVAAPGGGAPTGTVQFQVDGTNFGSPVNISTTNGFTTASVSTATLSLGSHTLTVSYSGDSNFTPSTSATFTQTVSKASSSTAVAISTNPTAWGQNAVFTATVSVNTPGSGTPTGTVQFLIDGTNVGSPISVKTTNGATTASFSTAALSPGSHTVTASYSGDSNIAASTSAAVTQTVSKASSSTALAASPNATVSGQGAVFTATLSITATGLGSPTGTVQFQVDGTNAGSPVSVSTTGGLTTASFTSSALSVGNHTVTASYSGDSNFAASTSAPMTQTVTKATSSTAVATSTNPIVWGQSAIFTATVNIAAPGSGTPTGTVQFLIDGTNVGSPVAVSTSGGLTTAAFTSPTLSAGSHTITANYSGDSNFSASVAPNFTQTVTQATTAEVVITSGPSTFGQSVTFTATITGNGPVSPTGVVIFSDGGTNLGQATLSTSGGTTTASFSTLSLAGGIHTITASYGGDSNFLASTATLMQTVNKASPNSIVVSSASPAVYGQPVTFTATVSTGTAGSAAPTGTVQFQVDGNAFGNPVPLGSGQATSTALSTLSVGGHTITASYSGDSNFAASTATLNQSIIPGPASVVILSGLSSLTAGAAGTFTLTVQDAYGNTATGYRGTVHFTSSDSQASLPADYTFMATDNGVHAFTATFVTAGTQLLTAGDAQSGLAATQSGIAISPAAAAHFLVTPGVATTVAGAPFAVTITVQDAYNNTVTGYTGSVSFSSADPHGATLPAGYTFTPADNGSHAFPAAVALYKVGTWDVTVTDMGSGIAGTTKVSVTPAPAVGFQVVAPTSTTPNASFDVTVIALDPYANVDTNYQGTITFSTTDADPGVVLPGSYSFVANDAGMHTFAASVTLVTPGGQTFSVADANGLAGSAAITVMPPPPPGAVGGGIGDVGLVSNPTIELATVGTPPVVSGMRAGPVGTRYGQQNGDRATTPWSEQPSEDRVVLLGVREVTDLLFASGQG